MSIEEFGKIAGIVISISTAIYAAGMIAWKKIIKPRLDKAKSERLAMMASISAIHLELRTATDRILYEIEDMRETHKITLNAQKVPFWISDKTGSCEYASPELCRIMGHNESEILGLNWIKWLIPEDKQRIREAWEISVKERTAFDEFYTYINSDSTRQKVWGLAFHKTVHGEHAGTIGRLEKV